MKKWKTFQICPFVLICIFLNLGGRLMSTALEPPLWLDSLGTALCAYVGGPVCGAFVGATSSLLYGMLHPSSIAFAYCLVSALLGIIVGFAAKRGMLKTFIGTLNMGVVSALACALVCVPFDLLYADGLTGNMYGDGVLNLLSEHGYPRLLCIFVGELYIEFPDKAITMIVLFVLVHLAGFLFRRMSRERESQQEGDFSNNLPAALAAVLCLGSLLAGAFSCKAQENTAYNDYVQTIYNSSNGLPCGEANDIAQTNDGILWIGTYAGLYRYNGSEFGWMDGYESVRNVNCLFVDTEGRLWIGTNDNGLSIAINEKIVNVVDEDGGLPSNSVRSITQSSDGYYYIGTTGSMQILSLNSGLKRVNTLWEVYYCDKSASDGSGHVAAVTSDGRLFLLEKGEILSSLQLAPEEGLFNCCTFDGKGRLLAGTSSGKICTYDISGEDFAEEEQLVCGGLNSLNDLYFLESGELFVAADNGIGYINQEGVYHTINVNGFNNSIDNMLVDYQGNLWYTSSRLGLLCLSPSAFKDVYSTVGLQDKVVNTVAKWNGHYYIGTDKGLDIVDESCDRQVTNSLTELLKDVRIRCMKADSKNNLWICTYGQGLLCVEPYGEKIWYNLENGSFGNRARLVTELSDGTILAAGDTGISFIKDKEITRTIGYADGLINSMILTITEMDDGRILAGTDGDGIAVIENGQVALMLTRADGLSSEVILRTVKDEKGNGVFLVTSNGLCYMDETQKIRCLENFPYFNNYDVWVKDEDTLFITGSAGIYVMDREELLSGAEEISYDLLDGRKGLGAALTANSWNYEDGQGNLFLSCDRGVFVLDTESYNTDNRSYRMNIASVLLDNIPHKVISGSPIHIGRGVSRIELFPEIINYTIQNPYIGYYLEGFENQWNIMPQSSVSSVVYTNVPMGEYVFHLAVFDSNKNRILEERQYSLVKDREIYDNRWFKIYMLVVAMAFVAWITFFLLNRQITRTLEKQQAALEVAQKQVQMGNETVMAIAKAVDAKDVRTSEHSLRVSEYSVLIGRELGMSEEEVENLRRAARMHDIGKIGIPDRILNKPARLDDEEYTEMKTHVTRGSDILEHFTLIEHVVEGARYHHERYDGRGYPDGLKGEEIPLYGRIIGVADAFDAMTASRVYRKQMDFEYVLGELKKGRGTQFDPKMVDILLRLIDEGKIDLNKLYGKKEEDETNGSSEVKISIEAKNDEKENAADTKIRGTKRKEKA